MIRGWTAPAQPDGRRNGPRWRLVGNAVTVGVSTWLGSRLARPGEAYVDGTPFTKAKWPAAAWGSKGEARAAGLSMWPVRESYRHLLDLIDLSSATPLSPRATAGFLARTERSTLRFDEAFLVSMKEHLKVRIDELPAA